MIPESVKTRPSEYGGRVVAICDVSGEWSEGANEQEARENWLYAARESIKFYRRVGTDRLTDEKKESIRKLETLMEGLL